MMRRLLLILLAASCTEAPQLPEASASLELSNVLGGADSMHARAMNPRTFTFPQDHGPHPEFRTEWWYFTGNVTADDGRELGYQLTFFRSALTDSTSFLASGGRSDWRARHAWMAHFAVSDARDRRFHANEQFARDALGLAGADTASLRVWLKTWRAEPEGATTFPLRLQAADGDVAIDLLLEQGKPVVLQGDAGLSMKGSESGNASYYYSLTRMPTRGMIRIGEATHVVSGASWLDREWSTSVLGPELAGWDWMSLQLDDGTELMLYHLRRRDGSANPFNAATIVDADGSATSLSADRFEMTPRTVWRASETAPHYPIAWRIRIPSRQLQLEVEAAFPAQELRLAVRYWEGMVRVRGTKEGARVSGRGYLEMTGYDQGLAIRD